MLKKILSGKTCAECRMCCNFDIYDMWETPLFSADMLEKIKSVRPDAEFIPKDGGYIFRAREFDEEQLFSCPALTDTGCMLGDGKPFECRIFPYRIMSFGERLIIALASVCDEIYSRPLSQLTEILRDGLAEEIFAYADTHPEIVKPYYEGYPVLMWGINNE